MDRTILLRPQKSSTFRKKKRERDDAKEKERLKNCPPEDDGWCEREQRQLLSRQMLLSELAAAVD